MNFLSCSRLPRPPAVLLPQPLLSCRDDDQPTVTRTREVVDHYPGIALGDLAHAVGEPMLVFPTVFHMFVAPRTGNGFITAHTLSLRTCSARHRGWGHVAKGAQ